MEGVGPQLEEAAQGITPSDLDLFKKTAPSVITEMLLKKVLDINQVGGQVMIDIIQMGGQVMIDIIQVGGQVMIDINQVGGQVMIEINQMGGQVMIDIIQVGGQVMIDINQVGGQVMIDCTSSRWVVRWYVTHDLLLESMACHTRFIVRQLWQVTQFIVRELWQITQLLRSYGMSHTIYS